MRIIYIVLIFIAYAVALQCVDESNTEVDWYVLYKIPHIKKEAYNSLVKKGVAYLYITSNNQGKWKLSNVSVNSSDSFLYKTLEPIYNDKGSNLLHIFYNDEPPNKSPKGKKGHTKGVVAGDENGGFWLVHSVPLYPPAITDAYAYPLTGSIYGQSVLCISLDKENLNAIGTQLQYNQPQIYSSHLSTNLSIVYPNLRDAINGDPIDNAPWFHLMDFKSRKGEDFRSFAKTRDFLKDLYEDWVAPVLNVGLYVESWLNGPGKLSSNCTKPFSVYNVQSITLDAAKTMYKSALDHSKWAVANDSNSYWACVGDINRAEHQKHRGGGTVCFQNVKVANSYRSTISSIENCK